MRHRFHAVKIYALVGVVSLAALSLLVLPGWEAPGAFPSKFWNALAAFAILGIVCASFSSRLPFAKVSTSVGFIPLIASVPLFRHPWPMLVAGVTALVVESLVRHKPTVRVWFNTAQYMLATGLGALVYVSLGGVVSSDVFDFALIPFAALVFTFFTVNQGSVALAVSISSDVSLGEAWDRIGKDTIATDVLSSTLAILLVFLYAKLQLLGIAILIFPLFLVRELYQMNQQLQEELEEKLELMVKAMEARDPYTSGHSRRVAEYAVVIGRELRLSSGDLDTVKRAALLHDVGKIYEEFAPLLRKDGRLTPEEMMIMRSHVVRSAQLVATATSLRGKVEAMIRHHHENYDGSGYPDGLSGEQIPMGARIIMVADTVDAMTTDRPYRKALSLQTPIDEPNKYQRLQFDPKSVELVARSPGISGLLGAVTSPEPSVPRSIQEGTRIARARA